jgi:hypothetical protein
VPYLFLADLVLFLHFAVVVFVVGGLVIIFAGNWRDWHWVNGWWFRLSHLLAIAVIVAQAWLEKLCPLTTLESWLRVRGGAVGYTESFISYWLRNIIYYEAPLWVFTLIYTLLALLVLAAWWLFPPTRHNHGHQSSEGS